MKKSLVTTLLMLALAVLVSHPAAASEALMDPDKLNATAPDQYDVSFETSKGVFVISAFTTWSRTGFTTTSVSSASSPTSWSSSA